MGLIGREWPALGMMREAELNPAPPVLAPAGRMGAKRGCVPEVNRWEWQCTWGGSLDRPTPHALQQSGCEWLPYANGQNYLGPASGSVVWKLVKSEQIRTR